MSVAAAFHDTARPNFSEYREQVPVGRLYGARTCVNLNQNALYTLL